MPDVTFIHELLDQAAEEYHNLFAGHVPARQEQFAAHLATVKMAVDHSADEAAKE